MTNPRIPHLFSHLALALSGICLAVAEFEFVPEISVLLIIYLACLLISWHQAGRWMLPGWLANGLALLITLATTGWVIYRLSDGDSVSWVSDVPLPAAVIPYLGPVLMGLMLIRLFRPRSSSDFWLLQGVGLLQVALGCVLASSTSFGILLLLYLVAALCALAAHESQRQAARSAGTAEELQTQSMRGELLSWFLFSVRWTIAVSLLAVPLFLLIPRMDGPEWEPFTRFGVRKQNVTSAKMGYSEEIDLNRTGILEKDDSIAFEVRVTTPEGVPVDGLGSETRWRGIVLDRYEEGFWRSELNWITKPATPRLPTTPPPATPNSIYVEFRIPGKNSGLFLVEPVRLGEEENQIPLWSVREPSRSYPAPRFMEVEGNLTYLHFRPSGEYNYFQLVNLSGPTDRYPAVRLSENYLQRMLFAKRFQLRTWTWNLLNRLVKEKRLSGLAKEIYNTESPGSSFPPTTWEPIARLLCEYLARSGEYCYSLKLRCENTSMDRVEDFLMNVKQGSCERYAAGLTLMLRSLAIPTRIVKGYRGADYQGGGDYTVRQSHAHAWVETLVPSQNSGEFRFDWLILDPTPGLDGASSNNSLLARWWRQQQITGQNLWEEMIVGYNSRQQANLWEGITTGRLLLTMLGWTLILLGWVFVGWLIRQILRRRRGIRIVAMYDTLVDILKKRLYLHPRSDQTPRELAAEAEGILQGKNVATELARIPTLVVEMLYRQRYGRETIESETIQRLRGDLQELSRVLEAQAK